MIINTRDFGEIEVGKEDIITFPVGLFAFEESREFALISPLGEDVYPKWLQSAEDTAPCFIVFDPAVVDADYTVQLEPFEERTLKLNGKPADKDNIRALVIATVPQDAQLLKKTTVNLKAPIIVNRENNLAVQVILQAGYDFRFPLYSDDSTSAEAGGQC